MLTAQVGINSSSVSSKMKRRCTREEDSEVCALHKRPSAPKTNCEVSKLRHNGALPCSRKYPARKHFEAPRNLWEPEAANSAQTSPPSSCGWLPGCRPPANVREIRELQLHRASEIHLLARFESAARIPCHLVPRSPEPCGPKRLEAGRSLSGISVWGCLM